MPEIKRYEAKHTITFDCNNCKFITQKGDEFKAHMKDFHEITDLKGTGTLELALDGAGWSLMTYRYVFKGPKGEVTCFRTRKSERIRCPVPPK